MAHDYTTDFMSAPPEEREYIVFEKGEYPFTIHEINSFEQSRNGNDMLPVQLKFTRPDGASVIVLERLVFTEKALFKIHQFIAACSIPNGTRINFRDDQFIKYLKSKTGRATLSVETYVKKDGTEGKKNEVSAFVYEGTNKREEPARAAAPAAPPSYSAAPAEDEDDIPF